MCIMGLFGELRIVDDVPSAFAELVVDVTPQSMALSGGDTARRCYELLAVAPVDFADVDVFMGDERWVPLDHADSNEGVARVCFLDHVHPKAIHSMYRPDVSIDEAAAAYDRLVRAHSPIELVHLGLGPDGHTASLFPGTPALDERDRLVVPNGDDAHPLPRITLTFPGIERSRLAVFTVAGEAKRDAFARVRAGEVVPAARVRAGRVIWLVDPAAHG
jgi:6-phosphogluconolactonase